MTLRPAAHIHKHGVTEDEVAEVLERPREDRRGKDASRQALGRIRAGRYLRVIYVADTSADQPGGIFIVTAYELRGKPLAAYRRRVRRRQS